MMFSAVMVKPISMDCINSPSSSPRPIVSKVASSVSSIPGVMLVEP